MSSAKAESTIRTVIDTSGRARASVKSDASTTVVRKYAANELVFAVVAPVGAGPSKVAFHLQELLKADGYQTSILKAGDIISDWAVEQGLLGPDAPYQSSPTEGETEGTSRKRDLNVTRHFQDWGDKLRETTGDNAAVALGLIRKIRLTRAIQQGGNAEVSEDAVVPDGQPRAFILDSIRHPDEVSLLRRVYQDAFWLIGVFAHEKERESRLSRKYEAGTDAIRAFMLRDENAPELYGQKVGEAFHLSDYFVSNTLPDTISDGKARRNPKWDVIDQLGRLLDILLHKRMTRPFEHETGMFHAYGARMKSSCISRQVGAALVGPQGDLIATGTNEVPRAGGGTLSEDVVKNGHDHRCFASRECCSNVVEQNDIIEKMLTEVAAFRAITSDKRQLVTEIRRTRVGQLVEFSRAVHAEMDALLSAARSGVSTVNTKLYVTTFPCHSCARHVIAAGVMEVQYIEPYFQSRAFRLHSDAITDDIDESSDPGDPKVLFRPFIGVAPRLYRRAFYKDRRLKDLNTGAMLDLTGSPDGPSSNEVLRISYAQMEAHLAKRG